MNALSTTPGSILSKIHGSIQRYFQVRRQIGKKVDMVLGGRVLLDDPGITDSLVVLNPQKTVQKLYYRGMPKDIIEEYHALHTRLAEKEYDILWVNRKKCMLLLVPKIDPKGGEGEKSFGCNSLMFLDSFFSKYSEISLNLIACGCYLKNIMIMSLKHIW